MKARIREILKDFADQVKGHHCDEHELMGLDQALTQILEEMEKGLPKEMTVNDPVYFCSPAENDAFRRGHNCCRNDIINALYTAQKERLK